MIYYLRLALFTYRGRNYSLFLTDPLSNAQEMYIFSFTFSRDLIPDKRRKSLHVLHMFINVFIINYNFYCLLTF